MSIRSLTDFIEQSLGRIGVARHRHRHRPRDTQHGCFSERWGLLVATNGDFLMAMDTQRWAMTQRQRWNETDHAGEQATGAELGRGHHWNGFGEFCSTLRVVLGTAVGTVRLSRPRAG